MSTCECRTKCETASSTHVKGYNSSMRLVEAVAAVLARQLGCLGLHHCRCSLPVCRGGRKQHEIKTTLPTNCSFQNHSSQINLVVLYLKINSPLSKKNVTLASDYSYSRLNKHHDNRLSVHTFTFLLEYWVFSCNVITFNGFSAVSCLNGTIFWYQIVIKMTFC